jgi:hypothetical protein
MKYFERKEYTRDKMTAAICKVKCGEEKDGESKFWRANGRLQTFLNENLKSSSSEQNDSDFSFGGKQQDGKMKAAQVTTVNVHVHSD